MWCLVAQPNSVVVEVEVEAKAKGQEVLEKVCELLGIRAEADYFGLRYSGVKGIETWLNLRNPVERQVVGPQPYRFQLRVKFWVPPHLVLQDTTRHQMYLQVRIDLLEGRLKPSGERAIISTNGVAGSSGSNSGESSSDEADTYHNHNHHPSIQNHDLEEHSENRIASIQEAVSDDAKIKLSALLVQVEDGDHPAQAWSYERWASLFSISEGDIAEAHHMIKGMKSSIAEYWILKEVSTWDCFGEELFTSKGLKIGIGPHGINVYHPSALSIPYTGIKSASSQKRVFQLFYFNIDHEESILEAKCESCHAAANIYRALTERHAFYSCDTVRNAVTSQCIRDLKGTIVSIFNESSATGKKYVFDIRRTCREVHDNARRALFSVCGNSTGDGHGDGCNTSATLSQDSAATANKLATLVDALTCRICMDAGIDTVFFPCAHIISCNSCALRCETCPLCRSSIESARRVYLPTSELGIIS